jgi:hypothetical protein
MEKLTAPLLALMLGISVAGADDYDGGYDGSDFEPAPLCSLYAEDGPQGTYIAAYASEGTAGEYVLSLRQSGSGGTSQITQSGEFESLPGEEVLLSEMTLSLDGSLEVSLQTYSWDGEFICRDIL